MTETQDRVLIFDTTLRDGEQSPGATMTHDEKLEIARCSTRWASTSSRRAFPIASEGDFAAVSEIAKLAKTPRSAGWRAPISRISTAAGRR
jgi:2-isopropylmalate synthase